jgi:hypothetical protein
MKNRFYFFDAGFRQKKAWAQVQAELENACLSQGSQVILERSNDVSIRGVYREEELRSFVVHDEHGEAKTVEFKSFSSCEFLLRKGEQLLVIKNPSRGSVRSLISRFQDASQFQMFAEAPTWDLWETLSNLEKDNTDRVISRIDVSDFPFAKGMEGSLIVTGKLVLENLERFRKGRLIRIHGWYNGKNTQRFVVHANGALKVSGGMSFDEALAFCNGWRGKK